MIAAFTGTRRGMTSQQKEEVCNLLLTLGVSEVNQGCCIGSDDELTQLVRESFSGIRIVGHPCNLYVQTSRRAIKQSDHVTSRQPPLDRNRRMVNLAQVLIATPSMGHEEVRSGTWMTIRYARKAGKRILIVYPDGSVEETKERTGGLFS